MEQEDRLRDHLAPHYRLERELGRGSMGRVYQARDLKHGRLVAIKVLAPQLASGIGAERFLREIRTTAGLSHPNIVGLHDSGDVEGIPYFIMPYVEGESLRERLEQGGRLPLADAIRLTREVADALAYSHSQGVIHRDIKPGNILISGGRHASLADFGVARALRVAAEPRLTGPRDAVGSPLYMSPEQASGEPVDARTDIYSLGCVLYEMLAGQPPFPASTVQKIVSSHLLEQPGSLRDHRADVSAALDAVVLRCLEKDPEDRYGSAGELESELAGLAPGGSDPPRQPSATATGRPATTPAQRALIPALVTLALVATAGGVALTWLMDREGPPATYPESALPSAAPLRIAVLPPHASGGVDSLWSELVQQMTASELAQRRNIAVVDPLSLNNMLSQRDPPTGSLPHPILAEEEIGWAVRPVLRRAGEGVRIRWSLVDTHAGAVTATASATALDETALAGIVRENVDELMAGLEETLHDVARALDLRPWLARDPPPTAAVREFMQGAEYSYVLSPGGRSHFVRALRIDPTFIAPRVWMVSGMLAEGDTVLAAAHVDTLRSLRGVATPFEEAMIGWAEAAVAGDLDAKAQHLRVALRYSPRSNVLLYNLGFVLVELGQLEEALEVLAPAVESGWHYSPLYVHWGVASILTGETEGLREVLEEALSVTPRYDYIYVVLEALARYDGDTRAAERYHDAALRQIGAERLARFGEEIAALFRTLGRAAEREDRPAVAHDLLERAGELDPQP